MYSKLGHSRTRAGPEDVSGGVSWLMLALYELITLLGEANVERPHGPSRSVQMASEEQCSSTTEANEREREHIHGTTHCTKSGFHGLSLNPPYSPEIMCPSYPVLWT